MIDPPACLSFVYHFSIICLPRDCHVSVSVISTVLSTWMPKKSGLNRHCLLQDHNYSIASRCPELKLGAETVPLTCAAESEPRRSIVHGVDAKAAPVAPACRARFVKEKLRSPSPPRRRGPWARRTLHGARRIPLQIGRDAPDNVVVDRHSLLEPR